MLQIGFGRFGAYLTNKVAHVALPIIISRVMPARMYVSAPFGPASPLMTWVMSVASEPK